MKVSIKLLIVGFLFVSSGLLHASNTITNKTGQNAWVIWQNTVQNTVVGASGGPQIANNAVYTIPSDVISVNVKLCTPYCGMSDGGQTLSISANTSYDLILAPDNKTLVLSQIGSGSTFTKIISKPGKL